MTAIIKTVCKHADVTVQQRQKKSGHDKGTRKKICPGEGPGLRPRETLVAPRAHVTLFEREPRRLSSRSSALSAHFVFVEDFDDRHPWNSGGTSHHNSEDGDNDDIGVAQLDMSSFLSLYEPLDVIGNGSFGIIRKVRRKADGVVRLLSNLDLQHQF